MRWERLQQLSEANEASSWPGKRWGHTCNAIRGGRFVYVFGGYGKDNCHTNKVHVLDTATKTWSEPIVKGMPPTPRDSHSCSVVRDNLFVFGGTDGMNPLKDLHILDTSTHTWVSPSIGGDGPEAREGHSAAVIGRQIYIYGGCGKSSNSSDEVYYNDLYILNTETFTWRRAIVSGNPPSPRDSHTCSSWNNKIVVIGGEDQHDYYLSDVHILDTETLVWKVLQTSGQKLPPRAGHSTVSLGKYMFVFGGFTDAQDLYNDLYMLDVETSMWTKVTTTGDGPSARFSVAGDSLDPMKGGVLLFIGGCNKHLEALDDIFYFHTELRGENRQDDHLLERLSLRKQLKMKCREQHILPLNQDSSHIRTGSTCQPAPLSSCGQPSNQIVIANDLQHHQGKVTFQAFIKNNIPGGYEIETVIKGKLLRGVVFKPSFSQTANHNTNKKRTFAEVGVNMNDGNSKSNAAEPPKQDALEHRQVLESINNLQEFSLNLEGDSLNPPDSSSQIPAEDSTDASRDSSLVAPSEEIVQARFILEPGPVDHSVLTLQKDHRSELIWSGDNVGLIHCRRAEGDVFRHIRVDDRVRHYLLQSGFYGAYCIGQIQLDHHLITSLIERWRQETHTFHMPIGEMTITLQDVAIILGMHVDGDPIIVADVDRGYTEWREVCLDLLGLAPSSTDMRGGTVSLSWLINNFSHLSNDAPDNVTQQHTRAIILMMLGGSLLADKSSSRVRLIYLPMLRDLEVTGQMSWGSAILACLYRELCRASRRTSKEVAGPLVLLQLWAWERLTHIRHERVGPRLDAPPLDEDGMPAGPLGCRWRNKRSMRECPAHNLVYYRDQLDRTVEGHVIWQPYTKEILLSLPSYCIAGASIWAARVPLICVDIVEGHFPDRVMRQFGFKQIIPVACDTRLDLHVLDRRGRRGFDWPRHHEAHVLEWKNRHERLITGESSDEQMADDDPYMQWFLQITRRWISPLEHVPVAGYQPTGGLLHYMGGQLKATYYRAIQALSSTSCQCSRDALHDIIALAGNGLDALYAANQFHESGDQEQSLEESSCQSSRTRRPCAHGNSTRRRVHNHIGSFTAKSQSFT